MFNDSFKAVVKKATIKAVDDNGTLRRILEPEFLLDFTEEFAKGLGEAAQEAWCLISDGPLKKASIDAGAFPSAHAQFYSGSDQLTIKNVTFGDSAIVQPKDPEDFPTLTLSMSFSWTDESLLYFAKRLGEEMTIRLKRAQLDMPGTEKKKAAKKKQPAKQAKKQTEMTDKKPPAKEKLAAKKQPAEPASSMDPANSSAPMA